MFQSFIRERRADMSGKAKNQKKSAKEQPLLGENKKPAKPQYPVPVAKKFDPWSVLLYPHIAEKSMSMVDLQNKIVFVVRLDSSKDQIKKAFETLFDVKVAEVKTERTMQGQKKAFIRLDPKNSAADIATRLGVL